MCSWTWTFNTSAHSERVPEPFLSDAGSLFAAIHIASLGAMPSMRVTRSNPGKEEPSDAKDAVKSETTGMLFYSFIVIIASR